MTKSDSYERNSGRAWRKVTMVMGTNRYERMARRHGGLMGMRERYMKEGRISG